MSWNLVFEAFQHSHSSLWAICLPDATQWSNKKKKKAMCVFWPSFTQLLLLSEETLLPFQLGSSALCHQKGLMLTLTVYCTLSRCPPGYSGLSCEMCSSGFERVPGGSYFGTCAGCNCNGHASACDPINGQCLVN